MNQPEKFGNLDFQYKTIINESCIHTKNCEHKFDGNVLGKAKWVGITEQSETGACYLVFQYEDGILSDTSHESFEDALDQAEWEYKGILNSLGISI